MSLKQDHYKLKPNEQEDKDQYHQGRGAQLNTKNKFLKNESTREHVEGIDDWTEDHLPTQYLEQEAKTIVNKVDPGARRPGHAPVPRSGRCDGLR